MEASSQGECFFKLDCRYFDYDGKVFGEVEIPLGIPQFRGVKKINTLDVFPLKYHEQVEELKDILVACGQKFISLMGNSRKRREIEAASKQRAKDLKNSILNSEITWGDYNANFSACSESEVELHDFLQWIKKVSTFAKIRDDTSARLLSRLCERSSKLV
jgi:hypothetical protein